MRCVSNTGQDLGASLALLGFAFGAADAAGGAECLRTLDASLLRCSALCAMVHFPGGTCPIYQESKSGALKLSLETAPKKAAYNSLSLASGRQLSSAMGGPHFRISKSFSGQYPVEARASRACPPPRGAQARQETLVVEFLLIGIFRRSLHASDFNAFLLQPSWLVLAAARTLTPQRCSSPAAQRQRRLRNARQWGALLESGATSTAQG